MSGNIVITGHLGGIGSAITETFLDASYRVIGIDKVINVERTYSGFLAFCMIRVESQAVNHQVDAG